MNKRLILLFSAATLFSIAQSKKIDSLKRILQNAQHDTTRIDLLNLLGNHHQKKNRDSAGYYHERALQLSKKIKDELREAECFRELAWDYVGKGDYAKATNAAQQTLKIVRAPSSKQDTEKGKKSRALEGLALGCLGVIEKNQGNFNEAFAYFSEALKIGEELNDIMVQVSNHNGLGNLCMKQANYACALNHFFKALSIEEKAGHKSGLATEYGSIANVYLSQEDFARGLIYYAKAIKAAEAVGDLKNLSINYANIGIIYAGQGDSASAKGNKEYALREKYPKAIEAFTTAMKVAEETGNKALYVNSLANLASLHAGLGKYTEALDYNFKALKASEEIGNKPGIITDYTNIGNIYITLKKFAEAERYFKQALQLAEEINSPDDKKVINLSLSNLYEKTGRPALALESYQLFVAYRDSIFNEENTKNSVRAEMNFEFERKQSAEKAEREKEEAVAHTEREKEKQQQKIILGSVIAGLLLVSGFSIVILRAYRQKRKANEIILQQKREVEMQKQLVEEKQKEVLDSIRYAKRIQNTLLTNENQIAKFLKSAKKKS
jgi:tetratricopeptide (TPR) repeat protein